MNWLYFSRDQSPGAVAHVMAASQFDEPFEVADCVGAWVGRRWSGSFRLAGSNQWYRLEGDGFGRWKVESIADEPAEGGEA